MCDGYFFRGCSKLADFRERAEIHALSASSDDEDTVSHVFVDDFLCLQLSTAENHLGSKFCAYIKLSGVRNVLYYRPYTTEPVSD